MSTATKKKATAKASKSTTKKATTRKKTTAKKATYTPSDTEIRQRAFEIFMNRGGQPGREMEDWLQAEAELRKN